jgi:hypothetical protein
VRAEITNPEGKLSPGQFVQVRVELPKEDNVIAIPDTALVTSLYGDFVYRGEAGEAEPAAPPATPRKPALSQAGPQNFQVSQVFVKAGRRNGGRSRYRQGLKAGDEIVTAGQNRLSNGTPVVVDNTVTPIRQTKTGEPPNELFRHLHPPAGPDDRARHHDPAAGLPGPVQPVGAAISGGRGDGRHHHHVYPGASADLIQGFITAPIARAVSTTENIDYVTSQSRPSASVVTVQMKLGADPDVALTEVMSKVQQVRGQLPPTPRTRSSSRAPASSSR